MKRRYAVAIAEREAGKDFTQLKYHVLKNGIFYWVADPFPIEVGEDLYIFGEMFEYAKNKGSIGYTKLTDGRFSPWKVVIEEDYHLSFPNIFCKNGEFFMCPEANESNSIYLYRCERFPDKWDKDRIILDGGNYVDTIFYEQNGKIFGITYDIKNNALRLFDSEERIISSIDVKNAKPKYSRPAGKIYKENNKYYLPTQIGIPTYGTGFVLNEFEIDWPRMKLKSGRELYVNDFSFDKTHNYCGIHTINFTENYAVVDIKWFGFNVINIVFKFLRKVFNKKESIKNR